MAEETSQHQQPASDGDALISLTDQLQKAEALLSGDGTTATTNATFVQAITILNQIQNQIQKSSLFSTNETLDDVQTSSLTLIATEYHLGKAFLQLPSTLPSSSSSNSQNSYSSSIRKKNLTKAVEYFHLFLERCDVLEGLLEESIRNDYRSILLAQQNDDDDSCHANGNTEQRIVPTHSTLPSSSNRDAKIVRYRQTQTIKSQNAHLGGLLSRRHRLSIPSHEDLEGYDEDSLSRSLSISTLNLHSLEALEEIHNCQREMEMLSMAVQMERQRETEAAHTGRHAHRDTTGSTNGTAHHDPRLRQQRPSQPLKLTHVTQDQTTGQLIFRKEQIRSTVFRPSWNQPTMTLDELAEKEVADAVMRSEKQADAEEAAMGAPRRYDQLVRDGMEDDDNLVEASAVLDRRWDDWKDANPRGSGNKMGDVGDRNI